MSNPNKEFDEPQDDDYGESEYSYADARRDEAMANLAEAGEAKKAKDALPIPMSPTVHVVRNDNVETEIRYLCNHIFWHYVVDVHVQVGEEYNMALANRSSADIQGYITRGELIPFRAPIDAPRIVFRAPDTLEWDKEHEEWKTITHWNESYKQWGKREKRVDPQTGVESTVWVFWSDEAKTQWVGETNFIDHNDYPLEGK